MAYTFMAYTVMACMAMVYRAMAYTVMAYIAMASMGMAYIVMAWYGHGLHTRRVNAVVPSELVCQCPLLRAEGSSVVCKNPRIGLSVIVMAHIGMAHIVMAYAVMAYVVMACKILGSDYPCQLALRNIRVLKKVVDCSVQRVTFADGLSRYGFE